MGLSQLSISRLKGVHPKLISVVYRAVEICPIQILVAEGVRTLEKQKEYVAQGKSQTLNSRHLTGHAVDLYALTPDGKLSSKQEDILSVANAMVQASREQKLDMTWGAAWNQKILGTEKDANTLTNDYSKWKRSLGGKPFLDNPHFEINPAIYKF